MQEHDIIPSVMKYVRDVLKITCLVEVKICHEESIPYRVLAEHQERALVLASTKALYWKIADGSGQRTPCDAFCVVGVPAFVAVVWTKHKKFLTLIPIASWRHCRNHSERRSLTFEQAKNLSTAPGLSYHLLL